ncbi:NUDIX hydrolase [Promicromonospora aerolata]|uniref:NUDIX hydrolase n=1 Tax=Promicromonospora aerolata TaxID=195749 RepID=A0ABW4V5G4_9MICO
MSEDNAGVPLTQVFGERVLYDNPWVRLVQVEIEPPDGHRFWHHVVRLQTVSTAIVLNDAGDHVLLMRRHRFATDQIGWDAPGGIVENDESPQAAAIRETVEETGWKPRGEGRPVAGFQPMPGMVDTPHEVFVFHGAEQIGEPTDAEEAALIEWVPLTQIAGLIQTRDVLGSGTLVGLLAVLVGLDTQVRPP